MNNKKEVKQATDFTETIKNPSCRIAYVESIKSSGLKYTNWLFGYAEYSMVNGAYFEKENRFEVPFVVTIKDIGKKVTFKVGACSWIPKKETRIIKDVTEEGLIVVRYTGTGTFYVRQSEVLGVE